MRTTTILLLGLALWSCGLINKKKSTAKIIPQPAREAVTPPANALDLGDASCVPGTEAAGGIEDDAGWNVSYNQDVFDCTVVATSGELITVTLPVGNAAPQSGRTFLFDKDQQRLDTTEVVLSPESRSVSLPQTLLGLSNQFSIKTFTSPDHIYSEEECNEVDTQLQNLFQQHFPQGTDGPDLLSCESDADCLSTQSFHYHNGPSCGDVANSSGKEAIDGFKNAAQPTYDLMGNTYCLGSPVVAEAALVHSCSESTPRCVNQLCTAE